MKVVVGIDIDRPHPVHPVFGSADQGVSPASEVLYVEFNLHVRVIQVQGIAQDIIGNGAFLEIPDARIAEKGGEPLPFLGEIGQVEGVSLSHQRAVFVEQIERIQGRGGDLPAEGIDHIGLPQVDAILHGGPLPPRAVDLEGAGIVEIPPAVVKGTQALHRFAGAGRIDDHRRFANPLEPVAVAADQPGLPQALGLFFRKQGRQAVAPLRLAVKPGLEG